MLPSVAADVVDSSSTAVGWARRAGEGRNDDAMWWAERDDDKKASDQPTTNRAVKMAIHASGILIAVFRLPARLRGMMAPLSLLISTSSLPNFQVGDDDARHARRCGCERWRARWPRLSSPRSFVVGASVTRLSCSGASGAQFKLRLRCEHCWPCSSSLINQRGGSSSRPSILHVLLVQGIAVEAFSAGVESSRAEL